MEKEGKNQQQTQPQPHSWKEDIPHRRYNALTGEWILCSPHRAKRPWRGQTEDSGVEVLSEYDPKCYLCPGNPRSDSSKVNPKYTETFVFDNDFATVLPPQKIDEDQPPSLDKEAQLLIAKPAFGKCRVICFSPNHSLTLAQMKQKEIEAVIRTWKSQYQEIGAMDYIEYVQIFENKGSIMGCSNPHPHCQIWSSSFIPEEPAKEILTMTNYKEKHGSCLLCDYVTLEQKIGTRIVCENDQFLVVVPYWALWPYETLILSKSHLTSLSSFEDIHIQGFADVLRILTCKYDNLFKTSFPYSSGIHQLPTDGKTHEVHFHMHFYPPLLRSATIKKFMVGFEMLGEPQRDITAEQSAAKLQTLDGTNHYKTK
jgi:UDPglucose--hexose-1-phosphate uridylyltransferase